MFICARAASLYALGHMKEKEYIEVGEETITKELKEFLLKSYAISCGYCGRSDEPIVVEPAIQLKD